MTNKLPERARNTLHKSLVSLREGAVALPRGCVATGHEHPETTTTTRTAIHRNRSIRIETTYRILIDDKPLRAHVSVLDDGRVHYHGLPNYSFSSALDLARQTIDAFSAPLPEDELNRSGHDHAGRG